MKTTRSEAARRFIQKLRKLGRAPLHQETGLAERRVKHGKRVNQHDLARVPRKK